MDKDLYQSFTQSKAIFDKADKTLGFALSALCFEGPQEELTKTNNCQPAILTVSIAALEAYKAVVKPEIRDAASYTAGLSLGEYSALVAAGALRFEDALYLVRRRGELMEEQALKRPGRMLSIIGLDLAVVKEICAKTGSEIANLNSPGQAVISGSPENMEEARKMAQEKGAKRAIFLEVSGAFHSSFMQGASEKLAAELEKISISKPSVAVVSNVTADLVTSPSEIKNNLIKQVVSSVLWEDSMKFMLLKGIMNFIEFGPGKILKGLMRRIDENAQVINIEKKQDLVNLGGENVLKG